MNHRTADQSKKRYIDAMGEKFGTLFHYLLQETYYLTSIWNQHECLFEHKKRIELLNDSGGFFFGNVQRIFFDYTILGICRLTDPIRIGAHENLSIRHLGPLSDPEIRPGLEAAIEHSIAKSEFCRDWRNRNIAHSDLHLRLEVGVPLLAATRLGVTEAIVAIHDVLRLPGMHYLEANISFVDISDTSTFELMHRLLAGQQHELSERNRLLSGDFSRKAPPDWLHEADPFKRFSGKA